MGLDDLNSAGKSLEDAFFAKENARLLEELRAKDRQEEQRKALRAVIQVQDDGLIDHLLAEKALRHDERLGHLENFVPRALDDLEPPTADDPTDIDPGHADALAVALAFADENASEREFGRALRWLEVAEDLELYLPGEYERKRIAWEGLAGGGGLARARDLDRPPPRLQYCARRSLPPRRHEPDLSDRARRGAAPHRRRIACRR